MKKIKAKVMIGKKVAYEGEEQTWMIHRYVQTAIENAVRDVWDGMWNAKEGHKQSVNNISISLECTMNRRAERRHPDIIAEEREDRAAKRKAKEAKEANRKKEQEKVKQQRRKRISNQIDHAFRSGSESGSEPVSKFITCENCDAPATFLSLNREVPTGSAVLDESTVVGAVCKEHNYSNNPWYRQWNGVAAFFPTSRLEFFYTGIRQIAIKEKP